jgi:hypothetical protein
MEKAFRLIELGHLVQLLIEKTQSKELTLSYHKEDGFKRVLVYEYDSKLQRDIEFDSIDITTAIKIISQ